jgi:hypothetical protein
MSPEAQRTAIAEACGWKKVGADYQMIGQPAGTPFASSFALPLPDYLSDLKAINEAEKVLAPTKEEWGSCQGRWVKYAEELCAVCGESGNERTRFSWHIFHATAAQRAEAFLRTTGRWEDGK